MEQIKEDLIIFVATSNNNRISQAFILELDLEPDDDNLLNLLKNNNISYVNDLWGNVNVKDKLTIEQEYFLVIKAKKGDCHALNLLMEYYYDYIYKLAKACFYKVSALYNAAYDAEDLAQEGVLSIRKAVNGFDIYKKRRFSTYIYYWARAAFNDVIYGLDYLNIPRNRKNQLIQLQTEYNRLIEMGLKPTIEELSRRLNMASGIVKNLYGYLNCISVISLGDIFNSYSTYGENERNNEINMKLGKIDGEDNITEYNSSPEEVVLESMKKDELLKVIELLPSDERDLLLLRFGFVTDKPVPLKKLAEKEDVSLFKIGSKVNKSVEHLREHLIKNIDMIKDD